MTIDKTIRRIGAIGAELDALVEELENFTPRTAAERNIAASTNDLLADVVVRQVADAADRLAAIRSVAKPPAEVSEVRASNENIIDVTDYREVPDGSQNPGPTGWTCPRDA
ncbi:MULTISPECIES: hypothetical protein [unclassified Bradyrhizobium]|uniref:hypothetical protein n=1 Tax=unclassified Bradyrhizobium TaxID=2631580 RepID=UPI001FFB2834|nr:MULTISPECIES: hypothetical protein [unclassified Bradyrhizobium]MCK1471214.1 hypothetical protein [Bradyrhizobium sp. CW10]UPK23395.1 hypothetical protein IVA73_37935 [Bradyrhizobium sp. 131]